MTSSRKQDPSGTSSSLHFNIFCGRVDTTPSAAQNDAQGADQGNGVTYTNEAHTTPLETSKIRKPKPRRTSMTNSDVADLMNNEDLGKGTHSQSALHSKNSTRSSTEQSNGQGAGQAKTMTMNERNKPGIW
ncbi:hypothetical protein P280DRAFT_481707 [Massarina eburnea CBS 473.64]|uniref:Uncharacterized protein n=1 Tax=Massarina eburnea CBS 473.64 TaxID=1395130 RepID=A0A6A6RW05_9PLEO|nr:hypothetical protein P280DRAFT_481707 [Massarina eburnea CBS 473.64]